MSLKAQTIEDLLGVPEVPPYFTARDVGKILQVNPSTVRRGCETGKYRGAFKLPDSGDWRIPSRFFGLQLAKAEERGEFA